MKKFLFFLISLISLCSFGTKEAELEIKQTKGPVKNITKTWHDAVLRSNGVIEERSKFLGPITYSYNKYNKVIKITYEAGVKKLEYDSNNRLVKEKNYYNRTLDYLIEFEYDSKGRLAEAGGVDESTGQIINYQIWEYKNDGNYKHTDFQYDENGVVNSRHVTLFNSKGLRLKFVIYDEKDNITSNSTYKYDKKGYEIQSNTTEVDNGVKVQFTEEHSYDENGLLIKTRKVPQNKNAQKTITEYKYSKLDKKGNWTKKTVTENGKPSYAVLRKIEYFN